MSGLSARNLLAMKIFAREFPVGPIAQQPVAQQPVAQLPWGHVLQVMRRIKDPAARDFDIQQTLYHGWSRGILKLQMQSRLHLRDGKAQNDFALTMPSAESDLAGQIFKAPNLFDFLGTADPRREAELEKKTDEYAPSKPSSFSSPITPSPNTSNANPGDRRRSEDSPASLFTFRVPFIPSPHFLLFTYHFLLPHPLPLLHHSQIPWLAPNRTTQENTPIIEKN
ncbi:hypothetical protein BH11VER1_BH11VER1_19440 [soil metagenome]